MTAPKVRRVDALTGRVANERFFGALSEADSLCRELDGVRELQCRIDELEEELSDLRDLHIRTVCENARLRQERDTWRAAAS